MWTKSAHLGRFLHGTAELDARPSVSVQNAAVIVSVVATVASAQVEAPAPSPTSGSAAFSPSIVSAGVAAVAALVFGSALRI
ncbi:hypothetical protein Bca52824_037030 [Brassica carinata]|uniref:Uncharacterized protein n=1 Tax=Brassica carinata TaxID=52824 RepID=A0A8X7S719_BRACI|nr:hypothetical protein Bca52824_037030 [Brassica carinata]